MQRFFHRISNEDGFTYLETIIASIIIASLSLSLAVLFIGSNRVLVSSSNVSNQSKKALLFDTTIRKLVESIQPSIWSMNMPITVNNDHITIIDSKGHESVVITIKQKDDGIEIDKNNEVFEFKKLSIHSINILTRNNCQVGLALEYGFGDIRFITEACFSRFQIDSIY